MGCGNGRTMDTIDQVIPGFRQVPRTGVIYVMHEAAQLGFRYGHPEWANLGQGSPETGPLEGAPPRVDHLDIAAGSHAYGPIEGDRALRQKVAELYNSLYRKDKESQYSYENVSIAGGGRLALTRVVAAPGQHQSGPLHSRLYGLRRAAVGL
jgi:aspartate/methionine/tyrosine aminotransferase